MPQVAISSDFLTAYAQIPRNKQKGVRAFIEKFKQNPTAASINYEPIHDMRDEKVRTVRIGLDYRGIVIHPPHGDVYVLVWIDHHDEAMRWARNKVFEVNKYTGTFQVWEAQDNGPLPHAIEVPGENVVPEERLLSGHNDESLLLLGVPEPLLAAVRALRTEEDLDELARYLPQEASEALYLLAAGYSVEETIDELDRRAPKGTGDGPEVVDTEDFTKALERPGSKTQFKIVTDDHELAEILKAPLAKWRIFLHPSQQKLVTMKSQGPVRVLGGAGTGKTVVAMHRARHLAKEIFKEPGQKVLVTTFTANLAADIAAQLRDLCGAEAERIEVAHLHGWAASFLKSRGVAVRRFTAEQRDQLWREVLATADDRLPQSFYREEWDKVIQPQGVLTEADYLHARRAGRGTRLTRTDRKRVWQVFDAYRRELQTQGLLEPQDLVREARLVIESKPGTLPYAAVVADEIQDFTEGDLRLLRAIAPDGPDSLFLVGDAHQRIYGHQTSLARCGIQVRGRRSQRLKLNYRTTQRIRAWATALIEGMSVDDLDENPDTLRGYHSLRVGTPPVVHHCATANEEADAIRITIQGWIDAGHDPSSICLVARTHVALDDRYRILLENAGHTPQTIATDEGKLGPGVRLATMHRVKGLEFECVLIAGVHDGTVPLVPSEELPDEAARRAHEDSEKRLLFVAATRARDELALTGFGRRCRWL